MLATSACGLSARQPLPATRPFTVTMGAVEQAKQASMPLTTGLVRATSMGGKAFSPAAELHVGLVSALGEHVYLTGLAARIGARHGFDSESFQAGRQALEDNTLTLAQQVGTAAPGRQVRFAQLWRVHVTFLVDLARTGSDQARRGLDRSAGQVARFLEEVTGGSLDAGEIRRMLQEHNRLVGQALEAIRAGRPSAIERLRSAADVVGVQGLATALAAGLDRTAGLQGDVGSGASRLRAGLSSGLEEHVHLLADALYAGYADGWTSDQVETARTALADNADELGELIAGALGSDPRSLAATWTRHVDLILRSAQAADERSRRRLVDQLDAWRQELARMLDAATRGHLPADTVAAELRGHVEAVLALMRTFEATFGPGPSVVGSSA